MNEEKLGLFNGEDMPDVQSAWDIYEDGLQFNSQINLDETVRVNENMFIGKQWEGVQSNGLPTPVINILKRVVGFVIATITTDNLKVNVTALANSPSTDSYNEIVRIVGEECEALMEHNNIPALVREMARNGAVDGDGCLYTYWDPTVKVSDGVEGAIKTVVVENTRVLFGNPNDRRVQSQPYIQIVSREPVREAKIRAKAFGSQDWQNIKPDAVTTEREEPALQTDDKVTVILTLFRNPEDGEILGYESTVDCEIRKPWSLGLHLYPITWFSWDYIQDCYHGEAMITGLIPNQLFINKAAAMMMLSIMRSAWPKVVYDRTRIAKWDNRVGGAVPVDGNTTGVATIVDPAQVNPQVSQFIEMAIQWTEESLGATEAALGEGKAYNTSAILSLQRASATPNEMTKHHLYECVEDLFRIYVDFMGEYYGVRQVDMPTPPEMKQVFEFVGQTAPTEIPQDFDWEIIKGLQLVLKTEVGASSYYSEIASMQTLDNLLMSEKISTIQYLERVPDSYVPGKRKLIAELREEMQQQQLMAKLAAAGMYPPMPPGPEEGGGGAMPEGTMAAQLAQDTEITGGRGYRAAARAINGQA